MLQAAQHSLVMIMGAGGPQGARPLVLATATRETNQAP